MSPSHANKKQIRSGGRFNFDRPPSDNSWPDWQIPDQISRSAPDRQSTGAQSIEEDYGQKHEATPMKKRAKIVKRRREPRQPGGWWTTLVVGALIGLTSFGIVFDLAGDRKIWHFIQSNLLPADSVEPGKRVGNEELPAPASQDFAKTAEPKSPPVQDTPPAAQAKPTAPEAAKVTVLTPAPPPPAKTEEPDSSPIQDTPPAAQTEPTAPEATEETELTPAPPPQAKTEEVVPPAIQPPEPQEPSQVAVDAANPAAVPSPLPETLPVPQKPADTTEQKVSPAPVVVTQQQGDVIRDCADCPELVVVSAGSFTKVDEANPKGPAKVANIDHDFAIGRNDITFDDWDKCVTDGACKPVADDAGWGRGNRPLIFVSFDDVTTQYLPWLSKLSGKVYSLPSKDEWQYAALGGAGAEQAKSQSGDASQDCFNASGPPAGSCADTFNGTAPAGSFPPNALGLYDMKGNVWEWSADCWRPFTYSPNASPNSCDTRVVLGGAWSTGRSAVNGQVTGWEKSYRRTSSIGFRVVRSLP
jgi:formylglycine-generating enzyme required for sulfatase activity